MKRTVDESVQHRVPAGANARVERVQGSAQSALLRRMAQELDEVARGGACLLVRRLETGRAVLLAGDDDGRDLRRIDGDGRQTHPALRRHHRNGLPEGAARGGVDVMQTLPLQWLGWGCFP